MSNSVKHNPDMVWRDEPDEKEAILDALERGEDVIDRGWVVIVDGGQIHQLNLIAGEIWCLCDGVRDEAAVAAELAEAIQRDLRRTIPVSIMFTGQYGIEGAAMSLPAIIGAEGVAKVLEPKLTDEQKSKLVESAETIRRIVGGGS